MSTAATTPAAGNPGHPRGLYTLFFTEMWERFSYYGMRALLVLFMVDSIQKGGMGLTDKVAASIYGLYTASVYLVALPGGWVADRLWGAQKCVWYGGMVIAAGHFILAIPQTWAFYLGLIVVVLGTGLLKPNISAIVGSLYPEGGARRDAGFTIFYMGINLGAAIGPLICSTLGEKINWHYGFAAAGVGMVLGLIQFRLQRVHLGDAGARPGTEAPLSSVQKGVLGSVLAALAVVIVLGLTGSLSLDPVRLARGTTSFIVGTGVCYFAYVFLAYPLTREEKQRVGVIGILFLSSALFWAGFEQAGSSLNLFADRHTERSVASLNFLIPSGWFQSLGPVFIIALAPVVAGVWVALANRQIKPSLGTKFGLGLIFLGVGFAIMAAGAKVVASGTKVLPTWLISTYLIHTVGELCVSPVGLSSVTKLAPKRLVGQMMGIWFLATSLGNLIAGLIAGEFKTENVADMPSQFMQIVYLPVVVGVLLIAFGKRIRRWCHGAE